MVFDCPAMRDVAGEGLHGIYVPSPYELPTSAAALWPLPAPAAPTTPTAFAAPAAPEPHPADAFFYPSRHYPSFEAALAEIWAFAADPTYRTAACAANAVRCEALGFEAVAARYLGLFASVREGAKEKEMT